MAGEKTIWDTLKAGGLNDFGIAGVMGNMYAESGLISNNLQNNGNTQTKLSDAEYTAAVDSGKYTNFVNDKYGYGLCQWTYYTRKQNLLDYAKSLKVSIGDESMQAKFVLKELVGYPNLLNILKTATSVKQASDAFLADFERPAKLATAQAEEDRKTKRANYGLNYYNKYASAGSSAATSGSSASTSTSKVTFTPRKTAPSTTDKHWIHTSGGGLNECIKISGTSCLPNCVGYAWGRFYEIIGKRPSLSRANAEDWYGYTTDGYKRSQTPALGAVICWAKGKVGVSSDGAGHVAIVEEIKANGDIVTSNSGYKSTRFWMQTFTKASNYGMSGYTFQGFILPPDSTPVTPSTPAPSTTTVTPTTTNYKVKITCTNLNIRKGPGTNYAIAGSIRDQGVYTMVAESSGTGASKWGKLKSGAGWISLDYARKI